MTTDSKIEMPKLVGSGDLVQRLRADADWWAKWGKGAINGRGMAEVRPELLRAAADEIARLRTALTAIYSPNVQDEPRHE